MLYHTGYHMICCRTLIVKVFIMSIKWEAELPVFLLKYDLGRASTPKFMCRFNFNVLFCELQTLLLAFFWSKQLALHTREFPCLSLDNDIEVRWTLASFFTFFYPGAVSSQIYNHIWNYMALQPKKTTKYENLKSSVTFFMVFLFPWMNAVIMLYSRPHMLSTYPSQVFITIL